MFIGIKGMIDKVSKNKSNGYNFTTEMRWASYSSAYKSQGQNYTNFESRVKETESKFEAV